MSACAGGAVPRQAGSTKPIRVRHQDRDSSLLRILTSLCAQHPVLRKSTMERRPRDSILVPPDATGKRQFSGISHVAAGHTGPISESSCGLVIHGGHESALLPCQDFSIPSGTVPPCENTLQAQAVRRTGRNTERAPWPLGNAVAPAQSPVHFNLDPLGRGVVADRDLRGRVP